MNSVSSDPTPSVLYSVGQVRRRQLFYVSGFDPLGPRRYRELARREGRLQGAVSGFEFDLAGDPESPGDPERWQMRWRGAGSETQTEVRFLGWEDIVRSAIRPRLGVLYLALLRTFWVYASCGALWALPKLRKGPLIAGLGAAGMMLGYLVVAALIGLSTVTLVERAGGAVVPLSSILGLFAALLALRASWAFEPQLMTFYTLSDIAYASSASGAWPKELDARLDVFAGEIASALEDPQIDEVLIVGHSSGAALAVSALARARRTKRPGCGAAAALLTLGQTIPMVSFLPRATALRRDLVALADATDITWIDVSSLADGACFALCDPVATIRKASPETRVNPVVMSAAFRDTVDPTLFRRMRWRFLRLHFQYLYHFGRPGLYDPYQVMAGPERLAERFSECASSPQVISAPVAPVLVEG